MARVLVIDDELHILRLIQVSLERVGHSVLTLTDPLQALATIRREQPELVVLDLLMPVVDGFEILRAIAADESLGALPVVVLSAKSADANVFRKVDAALERSDCPYVTKPFHPDELIRLIDQLLN